MATPKDSFPCCQVEGCNKPIRSGRSEHCEAHYYRLRRNGTLALKAETNPPPPEMEHTGGYVLEYAPDHPLRRDSSPRIYQHRRVYYDAHGAGPFACHWCGVAVTWDDMHVDHLNAVTDDNDLGNLVPSCPACNVKRGHAKVKATKRAQSEARVTFNGEDLCISEWAERLGLRAQSLRYRLQSGWPVHRALTEGRGKTGPKRQA